MAPEHHDFPTSDAGPTCDRTLSIYTVPARGTLGAAWNAVTAVIATMMGLAPHVLHHVGLFAGAAFVVGLRQPAVRRSRPAALDPAAAAALSPVGTWKAPAIGVAVFAAMFSLSAFIINSHQQPQPANTPRPLAP